MKPNEEEEKFTGQRFANLKSIPHPALVVNGIHDSPVQNSYWLSAKPVQSGPSHLPDSGPGLEKWSIIPPVLWGRIGDETGTQLLVSAATLV